VILALTAIISLNSVNKLIFVMVKSCVSFAVWTECLFVVKERSLKFCLNVAVELPPKS
jgi:hypothetical protein